MDALFCCQEKRPTSDGLTLRRASGLSGDGDPTAADADFDQISAKVEQQFKDAARASPDLAQKTQELADRAQAGPRSEENAKELGATVKTSDLVDPNAAGSRHWGPERRRECSLHHEAGRYQRSHTGWQPSGAVLHADREAGAVAARAEAELGQGEGHLAATEAQEFEGFYVQNLRDRLEKQGNIKINKKEMDRLKSLSEGS